MILKLISKLALFGCIILTLSYALLYLNSNYQIEYIGGIKEKLRKLKETEGNKIVIVGGSNASFGINTITMEQELKMPVVNMALHGSLSVKYMMEQVEPYLIKNDILIMSREPDGLSGDHRWNHMVGTEISLMPTYTFSELRVPLSDRNLFETSVSALFNTIKLYVRWYPFPKRAEISSVYDSRVFKGDNILPKYLKGTYTDALKIRKLKRPNKNSLLINGLKQYKADLQKKKISFYITPAVVAEGYFAKEQLLPYWQYISKNTNIPLLNDKKIYVLEQKYFLNSPHHPNLKGRALRTKSLIEDILSKGLVNSHKNNFQ